MTEQEQPVADVFSAACSSRPVLQHLTGRWGALAMVALDRAEGPVRFGELRRRVEGISDRMLSQTLGQLERDGMVHRTVHSSIPPHVEYTLTELGARVAGPLAELIELLEAELPTVMDAQAAYEAASWSSPGQPMSAAAARPATRPENRQPPRNVPSSAL